MNRVCPLAVRRLPTDFEMPPRSLARQLQSFIFVTILGVSATGCTLFDEFFDESVSLAEFAPVGAEVTVELGDMSRSQLVLQAKEGSCPTMADDIGANVDGKAMDVFIKGGKQPSGKGWICGLPTFRRNVAEADKGAASTQFVVDDETATVTVVATGLLLERTMMSSIEAAPVVPGVETSFEWSMATDTIDPEMLTVDWIYDDATLSLMAEIDVRVVDNLVFIRLPVSAVAGAGKLKFDVTANVPVEKCEGVPTCTASVHALAEVGLDIVAAAPPNP